MPGPSTGFDEVLGRVGRALKKASIPYMVIGGQAVLHYGEPRLTKDVDIALGLGIDDFSRLMEVLRSIDVAPLVKSPESFVRQTHVLPARNGLSGIRIDLIFSDSEYEIGAIRRAVRVKVGSTFAMFATAEDIIIQKLIAGRPRDLEDVTSILLKVPSIDSRYIQKWLRKFEAILDISFVKVFTKLRKHNST